MKKEFIDYLYEQRAEVQAEIDRLVLKSKEPTSIKYENLDNPFTAEINARRNQIFGINKTIEKYFETHTKPIN